jgi:hypothetical protein
MILSNQFKPLIDEGISSMADNMKTICFHEFPDVFENIEFDNDRAFLDPLLFAYFNSTKDIGIENILSGYYKKPFNHKLAFESQNRDEVIYLPNIGYFYAPSTFTNLLSPNEKPLFLSNGIEVYRHSHQLWKNKFKVNNEVATVEVSNCTKNHFKNLQKAFYVIEKNLPELHAELLIANRSIILFHNPSVLCFVSLEIHGASFLSTIPDNNEIFFLEEIIHQCSHNTFNSILFNRERFFKIDPEKTLLGELNGNVHERRTLYSAFHGLFTVAKRYEAFYNLYKNNVFEGRNRHEFLGRFADIKKRFRTGIELVDHKEVFTDQGLEVYETLDSFISSTLPHVRELDEMFDLSNQPSEFSYSKFCEFNPFQ